MRQPEWRPGSFLDNLNAAAVAVGFENLPIAWGLAKVPWKSTRDRDEFLAAITRVEDAA